MRQRVLGDDDMGPDRGKQLILGDHARRVGDQVLQHREALGAQGDLGAGAMKARARNIDGEFTESVAINRDLRHWNLPGSR